jgi:hypothetical protein
VGVGPHSVGSIVPAKENQINSTQRTWCDSRNTINSTQERDLVFP